MKDLLGKLAPRLAALWAMIVAAALWLLDRALRVTLLRMVWDVIVLSARNPKVLVVYSVLAIGGYVWGVIDAGEDWGKAMSAVVGRTENAVKVCKAEQVRLQALLPTPPASVATPVAAMPVPAVLPPPKKKPVPKAAPKASGWLWQ